MLVTTGWEICTLEAVFRRWHQIVSNKLGAWEPSSTIITTSCISDRLYIQETKLRRRRRRTHTTNFNLTSTHHHLHHLLPLNLIPTNPVISRRKSLRRLTAWVTTTSDVFLGVAPPTSLIPQITPGSDQKEEDLQLASWSPSPSPSSSYIYITTQFNYIYIYICTPPSDEDPRSVISIRLIWACRFYLLFASTYFNF